MEKANIDIKKLRLVANFAKDKGVSRQGIYELIGKNRFDIIEIDGVKFVIMNEKAKEYKKTR